MSDSNEPDQTFDLSEVSTHKAAAVLGVWPGRIFDSSRFIIEKDFEFEENIPEEILEDTFVSLVKATATKKLYNWCYKNGPSIVVIDSILQGVTNYFIRKYELTTTELEIQHEPELRCALNDGRRLVGRMDFAVLRTSSNPGDKSHVVIVVECKRAIEALNQFCIYLKGLKELQPERKVGFCHCSRIER